MCRTVVWCIYMTSASAAHAPYVDPQGMACRASSAERELPQLVPRLGVSVKPSVTRSMLSGVVHKMGYSRATDEKCLWKGMVAQ